MPLPLAQRIRFSLFGRYIAEGWLACEQAFIHDSRADAYEKNGNPEEAKWQREQAREIRLSYGQDASQW